MNLYKINVKYKTMNLHSKFYILFVHNRRKITKNLTFEQTSESILSWNCRTLASLSICRAHSLASQLAAFVYIQAFVGGPACSVQSICSVRDQPQMDMAIVKRSWTELASPYLSDALFCRQMHDRVCTLCLLMIQLTTLRSIECKHSRKNSQRRTDLACMLSHSHSTGAAGLLFLLIFLIIY